MAPLDFLGDITGDLNAKRGRIETITDRANIKVIDAKVPLSEMFGYATKLRSMTQGRGSFTMEFNQYEEVPTSISQLIIEGKKWIRCQYANLMPIYKLRITICISIIGIKFIN